jgi:hypothetical protein
MASRKELKEPLYEAELQGWRMEHGGGGYYKARARRQGHRHAALDTGRQSRSICGADATDGLYLESVGVAIETADLPEPQPA